MAGEKTHCALCGVRDHALGGRRHTGEFMLALPLDNSPRVSWPRVGTNGWCGNSDGEVERLSIVRIKLARTTLNCQPAVLCQHCLTAHQVSQGVFTDLLCRAEEGAHPQ